MTNRSERKKEETKQKIISIAVNLFREHSFEATTMEQIAEEVDIAKGTLYNYFSSKEAILSEYVQRSFKEQQGGRVLDLRMLPDTRSRLTFILTKLIERVEAQQDIFEMYLAYRVREVVSLRPNPQEGIKSGFALLSREIIQLGQESGEVRSDLPSDMMADLFEFVFVEVAKRFYLEPDTFNARDAIEQGVSLFMNGVGGHV
jgi:AcrR family transcriptional regulator